MKAKLTINQKDHSLHSLILPEMSLSSARSYMIKEEFELTIKISELVRDMQGDYTKWVKESKYDDDKCGGPQDDLAESGYPPIEQLIHIPELGELVFGGYLLNELFSKFSKKEKGNHNMHWVDEVTSYVVEGDYVKFGGICYRNSDT